MTNQLQFGYDESNKDNFIENDSLKIKYYENYFELKDSDRLMSKLKTNILWKRDLATVFGKKIVMKRKIAWYGDQGKSYTYSGQTLHPNKWNNVLLEIKHRIEEVSSTKFNSVLLNNYSNGEVGMGWHSDDEKELGQNPVIASVSFGAERDFFLKHKTKKYLDKTVINLKNGSLLLMLGNTQHFWSHSVPKRMKVKNQRINLTFRKIL